MPSHLLCHITERPVCYLGVAHTLRFRSDEDANLGAVQFFAETGETLDGLLLVGGLVEDDGEIFHSFWKIMQSWANAPCCVGSKSLSSHRDHGK